MASPPYSRETKRFLLLSLVLIQGYPTVLNMKGARWEVTGIEEDGQKRGLQTYSENGLHGNGCLAGLR